MSVSSGVSELDKAKELISDYPDDAARSLVEAERERDRWHRLHDDLYEDIAAVERERDEALAELDYVPDFAIAPTDYIPDAEWNAMTRDEQDRRCAEIFERERRRLRYGRVKRERDEALALLQDINDGVYGAMPEVLNERLANVETIEDDEEHTP